MLASVLPWEWILETLLDSKDFSLASLEDIIGYIPHIQDSRCAKLFQKVVLRYLEEITLTRKLNLSAITLIKYLLEPQGDSSLHRIHSLKESVENDLILRVETEVVLATIREKAEDGTRDWEAFADVLEEVFPESALETSKVERRKELLSFLSVSEREHALCEHLLNNYLEDLLKDLLQFIESRRRQLKTKFLDQLAKDVMSGSYTPSVFRQEPSTPEHVSEDSPGGTQATEKVPLGEKTLFVTPPLTEEPSMPGILLGEPIERFRTFKGPSSDVRTNRSPVSSSSTPVYAGQSARLPVKEVKERNLGPKKTADDIPDVEKESVEEDFGLDIYPSMMEIDKELTSHVNELVEDLGKFAADIHRVAVNSSEEAIALVATVSAEDQRKLDPVPFLENLGTPPKRPPVDEPVGSVKKQKSGTSGDFPARETRIDERADDKRKRKNGVSTEDGDRNLDPFRSISDEDLTSGNDTALYRRVQVCLKLCTERLFPRPGTSTLQLLRRGSPAHDAGCALCQRGGVFLRCHGCSVRVHERCLEELDMGKSRDESDWFCPSCIEQLTSQVLEKVMAEAHKAKQQAAAFVHATSKESVERPSSAEKSGRSYQVTASTGACSEPQRNADGKVPDESAPGPVHDVQPKSMNGIKGRELKSLEAVPAPPRTKHGDKRYSLRSRVSLDGTKESSLTLLEEEDLPGLKHGATTGVAEPVSKPSSPAAGHAASKCIPEMLTDDTLQACNSIQTPMTKSLPKDVVNEWQSTSKAMNCSQEGEERANDRANDRASGSKQNPSNSGEHSPSGISHGVLNDGNDHHEEEMEKHQVDAISSENEQTGGHSSPSYKRSAPRKGRYRGRWKIPGVRRKNLPWSETEVAALREGVQKYSSGGWGFQWKNILEFGHGKFDTSRPELHFHKVIFSSYLRRERMRPTLRSISMPCTVQACTELIDILPSKPLSNMSTCGKLPFLAK
ncbi:hypothetical protein R1flu_005035 [Riccia fluitans]|uniref:PHD-type domain-containing protein n=1 Tax=Riccia fluitans TaxID=41844 RepID=A0ABD1YRZ9_9MARC